MQTHPPAEMTFVYHLDRVRKCVYVGGVVRRCRHRYAVYRCPVCGRLSGRRRRPIVCSGTPDPAIFA